MLTVKLTTIQLTDPQDVELESRRKPGMLGIRLGRSIQLDGARQAHDMSPRTGSKATWGGRRATDSPKSYNPACLFRCDIQH